MAFSIREMLKSVWGGPPKERSPFASEKEAYDFCRRAYKTTGGATPELRRAYEFYMKNSSDGCEQFVGPAGAKGK